MFSSQFYQTDYHVHSAASFDADETSTVENILKTAMENNINQVAICDHYDVNWVMSGLNPKIDFADTRRQILEAMQSIQANRKIPNNNANTKLLLGVELGQPHQSPESDAHARELLREIDFDFVLCAMHNPRNEQDFYYIDYEIETKSTLEPMFERYVKELCELAEWHNFHALAHADYPARYFKIHKRDDIDVRKYYGLYKDVFKILIRRGIALEVNTSGLSKENFNMTMPSYELLKIYKDMGGELLTMGSDSHKLEQLADIRERFGIVYQELLNIGFKYITTMKDKKFEQIKIEI